MKDILITLLFAFAFIACCMAQTSGKQYYRVKGSLMCGHQPARDVKVKLVDDDFGSDHDDELSSGYTDAYGRFDLSGSTTELTTIDTQLKIYHDCDDGLTPCQRRWKFELPNHYISTHPNPKIFNFGTWNLEAYIPGESHDCNH